MGYANVDICRKTVLRLRRHITYRLKIRLGNFNIIPDISLLLSAPVSVWAITTIYVPTMGTGFTNFQTWAVSIAILVCMILSLFLHSLAHIFLAGNMLPKHIFLSPLGDPAHFWPAASSAGREALAALAGPLANCVLAVLSFIVWNLQINVFISAVAFFLIFYNLGLMALNLVPAFPFDGGRLTRVIFWRILGLPGSATRLALRAGWVISAGLVVWGIIIIIQQSRFSLETGIVTFIICFFIVISLVLYEGWRWHRPERFKRAGLPLMIIRFSLVFLLMLPLAAVAFSLIPLNEGLEAPGFTASVEPMVRLSPEYRHSASGSFMLTTVIPQAPILAGEWVYAHLDPSVRLKPQEQIVPPDKTPQGVSQEKYQMLEDSETTAIIVGLRLAGFPIEVNKAGVRIVSILPSIPAEAVLRPDDIITGIDGNDVFSAADLTGYLESLSSQSVLNMKIGRGGEMLEVSVPSIGPDEADGRVRIGISIAQYHTGFSLPFPVTIVPQKVTGGPSAGLMFTLGVYNAVTEEDLTGGKKIAGTGTIDLDGSVGPIGGVQQKVVAAERAGALYFLSPAENYEDAAAIAKNITVIKVATAQEAIVFLHSILPDT